MSFFKKSGTKPAPELDAHNEDPWRKKVEAEVRGKEFISTAGSSTRFVRQLRPAPHAALL